MAYASYRQQDDTGLITMDDGKANAFGPDMIEALNGALDQAEKDARAVVLSGRPGILSGGFDLKVIRSGDAAATSAMTAGGARLMMRLYGFPKPVVIACGGHSVALGGFLLLTADYRLGVTGDFQIGLNEVAIGMTLPPFALMLSNARISHTWLTRAALNSEMMSHQNAVEAGFLDRLAAPDALLEEALKQAGVLAKLDANAFARTKQDLRGESIKRVLSGL